MSFELKVSASPNMAKKFQENIDKLLECPICLERIKKPKMLNCQHSFCLECLPNMVKKHGTSNTSLECAVCRKKCKFENFTNFPDNLHLKNLLDVKSVEEQNKTHEMGKYYLYNYSSALRVKESELGPGIGKSQKNKSGVGTPCRILTGTWIIHNLFQHYFSIIFCLNIFVKVFFHFFCTEIRGIPQKVLDDQKMELFVKIRNGECLNLSVKPAHTIGEIKTQIKSLKEIPVRKQVLTLNGKKLENDAKLSRFEIENSILWLSYNSKEISIHLFEDSSTKKETFKLEVDWTETIMEIMRKIVEKKKIPIQMLNLYLGHGVWDPEAKMRTCESLADNQCSSTIFKDGLSLMLCGRVSIHSPDHDDVISVDVEAFESFTEFNTKVRDHYGDKDLEGKKSRLSKFFGGAKTSISPTLFSLHHGSKTLTTFKDSNVTLFEFGLIKFCRLDFWLTKKVIGEGFWKKVYKIYIKDYSSKSVGIFCMYFTTIGMVKIKYQEISGILDDFTFIFAGKQLEDGRTLSDYNIQNGFTINAILCLRGS